MKRIGNGFETSPYIRVQVAITVCQVLMQQLHKVCHVILEELWQILAVQVVKDFDKQ